MDNKKTWRNLAIYLGIPILIIVVIAMVTSSRPRTSYKYSEIMSYFKEQQVTEYTLDFGTGEMALKVTQDDGTVKEIYYTVPNVGIIYEDIKPYVEAYDEAHPDSPMVIDLLRPQETPWILSILPTIILMLILNVGNIMNVGYEKAFLMQNNMNTTVSELISTYVYKVGLQQAQYSFATAVGLFNSVVNFILLVLVNFVSKRFSDISVF